MLKQQFNSLLKSLKPEDWDKKINERTVKDVVAHMIGWEKEDPRRIKEIWESKEPPWWTKTDDYDEFNKKYIDYYKNYTPEQLIEELEKYQKEVGSVINEIGADNLKKHPDLFGWLFDETDKSHYALHLREIKQVRTSSNTPS